MDRLPALTQRFLTVFAVVALLALGGGVVVQTALSSQRAAYRAVGMLSTGRLLAARVVRAAVLTSHGDVAAASAGRELDSATSELARGRDVLRMPDRALHGRDSSIVRVVQLAAGERAPELADAIDHVLVAARRVRNAGGRGDDREPTATDIARLMEAERQFVTLSAERSRDLAAQTAQQLTELRTTDAVLTLLVLATLAAGAVLVVRPAARDSERLVAELLDSRGRLEAATREAQREREFATSLVTSASDAIFAFDAGLRITEWNPAMERWTGVARGAALGRRPEEFAAELDFGDEGRPYARALEGCTTLAHDRPGRARPDEPFRYFDVSCVPLRVADGAIDGGVVSVRDVTERVEAVTRLRASEARFHALFDQAPLGIVLHDGDGIVLEANPAFERLTGRPVAELRGMRASELSPKEDRALTREPVRELRDGRRRVVHVEKRFVRPDGETVWASLTICLLQTDAGGTAIVGMAQDISERKALEARLSHQAYHDPLTGLANRVRLRERVEVALTRASRRAADAAEGAPPRVAVLYVDLDDFKKVNDSMGHAAGDRLLVLVAERLLNATRGSDTVARLGGDEFAVLLENARDDEDVRVVAERIARALAMPIAVEGTEVVVGASVGIARAEAGAPETSATAAAEALLRDADVAMYAAKRGGKNRYVVHAAAMNAGARSRLELEGALRHALERDELRLVYQPIVELATGAMIGAEALVRWAHPTRGLVSPNEFIPLAEETGLIVPLGRWVLTEACRRGAAWHRARVAAGEARGLTMTVNLSARQLLDPELPATVAAALAGGGLPPSQLLLELTESVLAQHDDVTRGALRALKALGVRLAIDDFGTGYSSLRYLHRFPVDVLKIDKSFVAALGVGEGVDRRVGTEGCDAGDAAGGATSGVALARAVLALGDTLSVRTVAEGVETAAQRDTLLALGCRFGQGYYFARPLPPEEAAARLGVTVETAVPASAAGVGAARCVPA